MSLDDDGARVVSLTSTDVNVMRELVERLADAIHGGAKTVAEALAPNYPRVGRWPEGGAVIQNLEQELRAARAGREEAISERNRWEQMHADAVAKSERLERTLRDVEESTPEPHVRLALSLLILAAEHVLEEQPGSLLYVRRLQDVRKAVAEARDVLGRKGE